MISRERDLEMKDIINILAITLSPIIAVLISIWLQDRKEKRQQKLWLLYALISTRHTPLSEESIKALNSIDLVFWDENSVRRLWKEYFEMLNNQGLQNDVGYRQRTTKLLELITEMANVLGYKDAITALDVDRIYLPTGLGKVMERNEELANELLRVLKSSNGFKLSEKTEIEIKPEGILQK